MEQEWAVGPGAQGRKVKVKIRERTWSKSGWRALGPREEKQKSVERKELGVWAGGGPLGPGEKTKVS